MHLCTSGQVINSNSTSWEEAAAFATLDIVGVSAAVARNAAVRPALRTLRMSLPCLSSNLNRLRAPDRQLVRAYASTNQRSVDGGTSSTSRPLQRLLTSSWSGRWMKTCVDFTRMAEEIAVFLPVFGSGYPSARRFIA